MPSASTPSRPRLYLGIIFLWFVASVVLASTGRLQRLRPPAPQLVLVGLTILLVFLTRKVKGVRAWLEDLDVRWVLALHVTRLLIGWDFLVLSRRGVLPAPFGVPAGWGDVVVGLLALVLLVSGSTRGPSWHRWYLGWNWLGLLDLVFVVGTAARLALADPASMSALLQLPLSLLPTFWVPILLASHLVMLRRVASTGQRS